MVEAVLYTYILISTESFSLYSTTICNGHNEAILVSTTDDAVMPERVIYNAIIDQMTSSLTELFETFSHRIASLVY